jgi:indole-3-glycerol phosphate synthase
MHVALECQAKMIGVNSRDLASLETDLGTAERLIPVAKGKALTVAESALSCFEDVERVRRAGADAVLIGTAFCSAPNIGSKVREVMGW